MLYCYDERVPLESYESEIKLAILKKQAIFYSDEYGFRDSEGKIIDIKDRVIVPRTFVTQVAEINKAIEENGGLLLLSLTDDETILEWPKYYKPKRNAIILSGEDLINDSTLDELEKSFGNKIFIKTKEKNFNAVITLDLLRDKESNFYKALLQHLDEDFIISRAVHVLEDQHGVKEYRCFVLNNKVANISRYTEDILHGIDLDVLESARRVVSQVEGIMPAYYVVDLFEYEIDGRKEIDVVEFNPLQSSGIYLYNSAVDYSKDILHKDVESVSFEYKDKLGECFSEGEMINKREPLYKVPLSFANTLASVCLWGDGGMGFFRDVDVNIEDYYKHSPRFKFNNFTLITDDTSLNKGRLLSDADLLGDIKLVKKDF